MIDRSKNDLINVIIDLLDLLSRDTGIYKLLGSYEVDCLLTTILTHLIAGGRP